MRIIYCYGHTFRQKIISLLVHNLVDICESFGFENLVGRAPAYLSMSNLTNKECGMPVNPEVVRKTFGANNGKVQIIYIIFC